MRGHQLTGRPAVRPGIKVERPPPRLVMADPPAWARQAAPNTRPRPGRLPCVPTCGNKPSLYTSDRPTRHPPACPEAAAHPSSARDARRPSAVPQPLPPRPLLGRRLRPVDWSRADRARRRLSRRAEYLGRDVRDAAAVPVLVRAARLPTAAHLHLRGGLRPRIVLWRRLHARESLCRAVLPLMFRGTQASASG